MGLGTLVVGGSVEERVGSGGVEDFLIGGLRNERMFAKVAACTCWIGAFR